MSYTMTETVLGALLHDIGKFMQRAKLESDSFNRNMESILCPLKETSYYSHQHVLWTDAFFNWLEKESLWFPAGINLKNVRDFAIYHHMPDRLDREPWMGWISALADRWSAGFDRKDDHEEDKKSETQKESFRKKSQQCIFDHIILDPEKFDLPSRHAYKLGSLDPYQESALFPGAWPESGIDSALPAKYAACWEGFCNGYKAIAKQDFSLRLFEEALLSLLERYTWAIPSSTIDLPDISLYDHAKTTAAIAACLFRYHEEKGDLSEVKAVKNKNELKFRFLVGDLSGIQSTLFTLQKQGAKGVNKILRARSFLLGAIIESAALQIIELLSLPLSCILQQAGGRFLLLVPNIENLETRIQNFKKESDKRLLEHYTGSLALNLALSPAFAGEDFKLDHFNQLSDSLNSHVEESKQQPLSTCQQGVIALNYADRKVCSVCGKRPARNQTEDDGRCMTCEIEFNLGAELPKASYLTWTDDGAQNHHSSNLLGINMFLSREPPAITRKTALFSVRKIKDFNDQEPWARRYLANYIPFLREKEINDSRYKGLQESDELKAGEPKPFACIAADGLEWNEKAGEYHGKPFLGLLKADVDRLGMVFSHGFKKKNNHENLFSISRLVQLSRMMDLYFTGYLPGLLSREFPNTYMIYAGGDDLLLIGPWYAVFKLAHRIQETFADYVGRNPNITLSTGISLLHANNPVGRIVEEAEANLKAAKGNGRNGRNRIAIFDRHCLTWPEYEKTLKNATWVHEQLNASEYPVSTGFIYQVLQLTEDASEATKGNVGKAGWQAKLAYHLARNIKDKNKKETIRRRYEWLEQLGFKDQNGKKSNSDQSLDPFAKKADLTHWRPALTIALYRNRK